MNKAAKLTLTLLSVSLLLLSFVNAAPGELEYVSPELYLDKFDKGVFGESKLPYRIYIPDEKPPEDGFPILLYLHGAGERGEDTGIQITWPPIATIFDDPSLYSSTIIIAPQCPEEAQWVDVPWSIGVYFTEDTPESPYMRDAVALVDEIAREYDADRSRLYITGLSMGGYGVWDALARHPGKFAAAIPICGGADSSKFELYADTPIRTYHCTGDPVVPFAGTDATVKAIESVGGRIEFNVIESNSHDAWNEAYTDPELFEWLFAQRLEGVEDETEAETESLTDTEALSTTAATTEAPKTDAADDEGGEMMSFAPIAAGTVFVIATVALAVVIFLKRDEFN